MKRMPFWLILVVMLSGCAAPTIVSSTPVSSVPEANYFAAVRQSVPLFADDTDDQLRSGGKSVCQLMAVDPSGPQAAAQAELTQAGLDATESATFIAASVAEYCPERQGDLSK